MSISDLFLNGMKTAKPTGNQLINVIFETFKS